MHGPAFNATGLRSLELGGTSFYLRDGLMEVWLAVVADTLAGTDTPWLQRLRDDLRYQATVVFDGWLAARLDPHLTSAERRRQFTELCHRLRAELDSGQFVKGPLASRVGSGRWNAAMAARLVRVTDAVLWLLHHATHASCASGNNPAPPPV